MTTPFLFDFAAVARRPELNLRKCGYKGKQIAEFLGKDPAVDTRFLTAMRR